MKYYMLFILIFPACCNLVVAQPGKSIRVKAGEDIAQAYSPQGFYRFPQFSKAILYFKGSSRNTGVLFNYNIFSGNMQFISPKGDTLDLANTSGLDSIVFETHAFVYNEGFMEVVAQIDSLKLLKKLILKNEVENIGAYGQANSTASITNVKTVIVGTSVYNLVVNQDVVLNENISWFFANGNNIVKANKTNLLKLLTPEKQVKGEAYLKKNKTSFERENDLKKLLEAIGS